MKHHCHCGLEKHLERFRVKKFGALGIVLMGAHILFHVVECLVLPAVLVAFSGHAVEEQAVATSESVTVELILNDEAERNLPARKIIDFQQSLCIFELEL